MLLRQKLSCGESLEEEWVRKKEMSYREFVCEWFENYVRINNKPSEIAGKKRTLTAHLLPYFGDLRIDEISGLDIEKYKRKKLESGLSKKTINNHLTIFSTCLKTAKEWHNIDCLSKIKRFKIEPKEMDFLSEKELQCLLYNSTGIWHNMILLSAKTGLRRGELIGLKWEDINFNNRTLNVRRSIVNNIEGSPKSNKHRTIPIGKELFYKLWEIRQKKGYVFQVKPGHHIGARTCHDNLSKICKRAGLRTIGWHTLRHTFASHLAMKGAPVFAIKELMGHADIQTTMRYAHLAPSTLEAAISVLEPGYKDFGQGTVNRQKYKNFSE